ncbi:MAG: response regulator [Chloroflexi bacterium]|nr:response regulator [Chloroflexota bacterium]
MSASKPLALVVEDDPVQAEIFVQAIAQAGYDVTHIATGDAAVAFLNEHSPLLVLLDLHLPEVAGTEILQHIRQQPHLARTRVMLATADPRMAETVRADSDLVLIKPISFTQLRSLAQRLLPS